MSGATTPAVHLDPVWRSKANFIIDARPPESDRPKEFEQLWVRQVDDRQFEMCCIPFFLFDIALGDVVSTSVDYVVDRVVRPSGRWVFRVWFGGFPGSREDILSGLQALGALLEWSSQKLLAVDAADATMAQRVADTLQGWKDQQRLVYDTGRS